MNDTVTRTDVIIVGAGPVGLFAVFELGLLGLRCHVLDILDRPGGQCAELYPEKPIYDIPAHAVITGEQLVERLMEQIEPFEPVLELGQMVESLSKTPEGDWMIGTDAGLKIAAPVVVIACGGGCFQPKRPRIERIEDYEGRSVFYSVRKMENFRDRNILIVGGGDSALDWCFALLDTAKSLTLVHRRAEFRAAPDSVSRLERLIADKAVTFHLGQIKELTGEDGRLVSVRGEGKDGAFEIPCDVMLPFFGLTVKLGPLADWGINLDNNRVTVDQETYATSHPGIYAIGDIVTYPGKLKLILSGFHEAALMAHAAFKYVHPDERLIFQHTSSSSSMQKRLGVKK